MSVTILIAITGYAAICELVRCREAGFDDYYTKPVGSRELLSAARDAFDKLERWKRNPETVTAKSGPENLQN